MENTLLKNVMVAASGLWDFLGKPDLLGIVLQLEVQDGLQQFHFEAEEVICNLPEFVLHFVKIL